MPGRGLLQQISNLARQLEEQHGYFVHGPMPNATKADQEKWLAEDMPRAVLLIDQYEELITCCCQPGERRASERQLAEWLNKHDELRLILTICHRENDRGTVAMQRHRCPAKSLSGARA